jgi:CheY-like chemotaxis protein
MRSILIIEPDLVFGMTCVRAMVVAGFQATHVTSAAKGLSAVNQSRLDAVLLSLRPRDNRSIQFLQEVRSNARTRSLPVIAFARENVGDLLDQARSKGANECLMVQSNRTEELVRALNTILVPATPPAKPPPAPTRDVEPPSQPAPSTPPAMTEPPVKLADARREPVPSHAPSPPPAKREPARRKTGSLQILLELSRALFAAQDRSTQETLLREFNDAAQGFTAETGTLQSFPPVAALSGALLALLKDLTENPRSTNSSNVRTIFQAINCLEWLVGGDSSDHNFHRFNDLTFLTF